MTVHKSQGSEFERALVVLPDTDSPLMTRELIYTALTRARSTLQLCWNEPVLRAAVARRTERASGLCDLLAPLPRPAPAPGHGDNRPAAGTVTRRRARQTDAEVLFLPGFEN